MRVACDWWSYRVSCSYFLKLPEVENYRLKRQKFENDRELQEQLFAFQELKDSYDTAKAYRGFRPDVRELKRQFCEWSVKLIKRGGYWLSSGRVRLQTILANLGEEIAQAVSDQIFIDTGLPLAP